MKATIESTTKIVTLDSVGKPMPARIWEGFTKNGIPFQLYVTRVRVASNIVAPECLAEFDADLKECKAPRPEVEAIPARLIL